MSTKEKNFSFEEALARIELINTHLEGGALTLDDSIKLYEEGVKLVRLCQKTLSTAEQKITLLSQNHEST
jgi:exodeoxyribonuclease VII small subunit